MQVAVATINYNGRHYVGDLLRSLRLLTHRPAAVFVVDNASTDGSAEFMRLEFPEVEVIANRVNSGFTGGVNICMRRCLDAGYDALLLMNPDTVAHPSMLEELTAAAACHPRGLLSPAICFADRPNVLDTYVGDVVWWRGRSSARYLGTLVGTGPLRDEAVETASGCCLFVPAEAIRDIGFLDEAYFLYFEDMDYLERAKQAGYEVWYVPAARVLHREGSATGGGTSPLALYYYIRNRHYFVKKFRHGTVVHALFIAYSTTDVAARALWFLVGRRLDVARAVMRGAVHGWRGQTGQDPGSRAKETGAYRV